MCKHIHHINDNLFLLSYIREKKHSTFLNAFVRDAATQCSSSRCVYIRVMLMWYACTCSWIQMHMEMCSEQADGAHNQTHIYNNVECRQRWTSIHLKCSFIMFELLLIHVTFIPIILARNWVSQNANTRTKTEIVPAPTQSAVTRSVCPPGRESSLTRVLAIRTRLLWCLLIVYPIPFTEKLSANLHWFCSMLDVPVIVCSGYSVVFGWLNVYAL